MEALASFGGATEDESHVAKLPSDAKSEAKRTQVQVVPQCKACSMCAPQTPLAGPPAMWATEQCVLRTQNNVDAVLNMQAKTCDIFYLCGDMMRSCIRAGYFPERTSRPTLPAVDAAGTAAKCRDQVAAATRWHRVGTTADEEKLRRRVHRLTEQAKQQHSGDCSDEIVTREQSEAVVQAPRQQRASGGSKKSKSVSLTATDDELLLEAAVQAAKERGAMAVSPGADGKTLDQKIQVMVERVQAMTDKPLIQRSSLKECCNCHFGDRFSFHGEVAGDIEQLTNKASECKTTETKLHQEVMNPFASPVSVAAKNTFTSLSKPAGRNLTKSDENVWLRDDS